MRYCRKPSGQVLYFGYHVQFQFIILTSNNVAFLLQQGNLPALIFDEVFSKFNEAVYLVLPIVTRFLVKNYVSMPFHL